MSKCFKKCWWRQTRQMKSIKCNSSLCLTKWGIKYFTVQGGSIPTLSIYGPQMKICYYLCLLFKTSTKICINLLKPCRKFQLDTNSFECYLIIHSDNNIISTGLSRAFYFLFCTCRSKGKVSTKVTPLLSRSQVSCSRTLQLVAMKNEYSLELNMNMPETGL